MNEYIGPIIIALSISSPLSIPLSLYGLHIPLPFDIAVSTMLLSYLFVLTKGE